MQALTAVKSPTDFIELQQRLIKEGVETAVGDSQRIAQLTTAVFTAAFEPIKKRIEAVQNSATPNSPLGLTSGRQLAGNQVAETMAKIVAERLCRASRAIGLRGHAEASPSVERRRYSTRTAGLITDNGRESHSPGGEASEGRGRAGPSRSRRRPGPNIALTRGGGWVTQRARPARRASTALFGPTRMPSAPKQSKLKGAGT